MYLVLPPVWFIENNSFLMFAKIWISGVSSGFAKQLCCLLNLTSIFTFRDSFFVPIYPVLNSLPINIRSSCSTSAFKLCLKRLFLDRLDHTFDVENIRSWRIICPLCRRSNLLSPCTCLTCAHVFSACSVVLICDNLVTCIFCVVVNFF